MNNNNNQNDQNNPQPFDVSCLEYFTNEELKLFKNSKKLVDVHAHLCDEFFDTDQDKIIEKISDFGVAKVIVNGTEPKSNHLTIKLSTKNNIIEAANGIYPVHAINDYIPNDHFSKIPPFNLEKELEKIDQLAAQKKLKAIGECGMDNYTLMDFHLDHQMKVMIQLANIAKKHDLVFIVHTRKCEKLVLETLAKLKIKKVLFHCFMGKVKLAVQASQDYGWYFSIPAIAPRHQGFTQMIKKINKNMLLTETDSPYLPFIKEQRNDSRQVSIAIKHIAMTKEIELEQAINLVWNNYQRLFNH